MGAPEGVPEFGLTRLCRTLSLKIQAPAVSDRTMTGGEKPPVFPDQRWPDRIPSSFISFRQTAGRVKTSLS
jgi:hypothetical protein